MDFLNNIKEIYRKVTEVESSIYGQKKDYLEVYERNLQLEKEIEQRTSELNVANKRMLTLQHILDMMNASKPLQSVLETIVNSIQGELGYMHCNILQKFEDEDGEYLMVIAQSNDASIKRVSKMITTPIQTRRLAYSPYSIYAETLKEKRILKTNDIGGTLKSVAPDVSDSIIEEIEKGSPSKSIITVPLYSRNKHFGWFNVFSTRKEMTEGETSFLTLFAQQIEIAITIADLFEAVKAQAVTDGLTGLYNRRYFEEYLKKEVTRSIRQKQPFSIIGLDLDFLKQINDKYGHAYGDLAIKTVANVLKKNARSIDTAARMGGEEFNVILPGIEAQGALIAAERIRKAIADVELDTINHVTASIGVATFLEHSDNVEELMELTDQAMYQSKRDGRNRVTLAKPISETSWQEIAVNTFVDILSKHNMPIPQDLSEKLCSRLKNTEAGNETSKEALYSVADILTQTYNPLHSQGIMKSKVQIAVSLAKRFDLPKEDIDNLRIAILLYDIGNLLLPPEILQKSGPLTEEERNHIKEHPIIAAREILKPISYIQDVIPIVEHHHENWDGTGYPGKIAKEQIPTTSQIVLIVDAYFALTEQRTYRSKLSPIEALEVIKQDSGKKWNAALVQEFVTLIEHDIN
ncbi:MAG: diguanylate cyclase [Candidatus Gastranaerophilaceae bacterium]